MARNKALKADVKRLRTLVTKKISRIKANTGALVSGTQHDPRQATSKPESMNARELRAYQKSLASFLSRENQFVSGYQHKPIHRTAWAEYKAAEAKANANKLGFYDRVKGIKLPGMMSDMDVEMRTMMLTPIRSGAQQFAPHTPREVDRSVRGVEYESKLRKLQEQQERQADPKYMKEQANAGREQFGAMLEAMGDTEALEKVFALTDEQFLLLYWYSPLIENASLKYEYVMKLYSREDRSFIRDAAEQKWAENAMWIEWAGQQTF